MIIEQIGGWNVIMSAWWLELMIRCDMDDGEYIDWTVKVFKKAMINQN